jgi:hypothetical protein
VAEITLIRRMKLNIFVSPELSIVPPDNLSRIRPANYRQYEGRAGKYGDLLGRANLVRNNHDKKWPVSVPKRSTVYSVTIRAF